MAVRGLEQFGHEDPRLGERDEDGVEIDEVEGREAEQSAWKDYVPMELRGLRGRDPSVALPILKTSDEELRRTRLAEIRRHRLDLNEIAM